MSDTIVSIEESSQTCECEYIILKKCSSYCHGGRYKIANNISAGGYQRDFSIDIFRIMLFIWVF